METQPIKRSHKLIRHWEGYHYRQAAMIDRDKLYLAKTMRKQRHHNTTMKKICIITPGTIASNPRVVKEAEALSEAGYRVHLIYTRHVDYLIKSDQVILNNHPEWTSDYLDWASNKPIAKSIKFLSGIKRRISDLLLKKNLYSPKSAPFLINRFYFWQLKKAISCKANLYIAHYPDSISIAAKAAKINNALFAYDAEDYHRGEDLPASVIKIISVNEDQFLYRAAYISASSQLIAKAYQKLFPQVSLFSLENMFPVKSQTSFKELSGNPFKFFWFSQTIGSKRGIEEFITILGLVKNQDIQLTLLGNVKDMYRLNIEKSWINAGLKLESLIFINTVPEKEIFDIASNQHFGLCLEIPSVPNKDFCMSNKLYSYILSGNVLIMSKTKAQKNFHEAYPQTGICIELEKPDEAAAQISGIMQNLEFLNERRRRNHRLGSKTLNFDVEKKKLIEQVAKVWD